MYNQENVTDYFFELQISSTESFPTQIKSCEVIFCGQKLTKNKFYTHEIALLTTEQKTLRLLMIALRQNPNQD